MVTTEQEKVLRVLDLVSQQKADDFEVLLPSVNVVAQEQVVRLRREIADFKDPQQIDVLSVDVSRNDKRHVQFE